MTLRAWIISAAIAWPDGSLTAYRSTTPLDLSACQRIAAQNNKELLAAHIVGFVTCVPAEK